MPISPFVSRTEFNALVARVAELEAANATQAAQIATLQTEVPLLAAEQADLAKHFPHQ